MKRSGWRRAVSLCLLVGGTLAATNLSAQDPGWRLTTSVGQIHFGGGMDDTTGGDFRARPSTTTAWGLAADHGIGRFRAGVGLSYSSSGLEGFGQNTRLIDETTRLHQLEIGALVSFPLIRRGSSGTRLMLVAGPTLALWNLTGEPHRTRFGALGALQLSAPLTAEWWLVVSATGSLAASPFTAADLPAGFTSAAIRSGRIGLGLQFEP